jgi:hypothetical protein
MGRIIEVEFKNFPIVDTQNVIEVLDRQIKIVPVQDYALQELVRSQNHKAMNTVSATAYIDEDIISFLPSNPDMTQIQDVVICLANLLTFAARRGVGFKTNRAWWKIRWKPIVRGKTGLGFSMMLTTKEVSKLIDRVLPQIWSGELQDEYTALRWFLGWQDEQGYVELLLIRLWIVLEMLSKIYVDKNVPDAPTNKWKRVKLFLDTIAIHDLNMETLKLEDIYLSRNALVHGDLRTAEKKICEWFGEFAEKRKEALKLLKVEEDILPDPQHTGTCIREAVDLLAPIIEKVFLNLFGCTDNHFYQYEKYFAQ